MIYVQIYLVDLGNPSLFVEELNVQEINWSDKQSKFLVLLVKMTVSLSAFLNEKGSVNIDI